MNHTNHSALAQSGTPSSNSKEVRDIVFSESFTQDIKRSIEAGVEPQALKSLSDFQDYLVAEGMTEYADLDLSVSNVKNHYRKLFDKYYSGKNPEDLDDEMRQQFVNMIQDFGIDKARKTFINTPEVAVWGTNRFDMFGSGSETISEWLDNVYVEEFPLPKPTETETAASQIIAPEVIDSKSPEVDTSVVKESNQTSNDLWEDFETVNTIDDDQQEVTVEPESVITNESPTSITARDLKDTLKERFSSERFDRAISTLERYGPEEGLRRLRENDPELATQFENSRRARIEDSPDGAVKGEDSQ